MLGQPGVPSSTGAIESVLGPLVLGQRGAAVSQVPTDATSACFADLARQG
jgi:hypothetical protein